MILGDILIATSATDTDEAFFFELLNDLDDLMLGLLYVSQTYRAERFHVLFHHFSGALRHVLEDVGLQLFACAL
jgi:hypothetical protein